MKCCTTQFNLILALGCLLLLGWGCANLGPRGEKVEEYTVLRFHLEVNRDGTDRNEPVTIGRSTLFNVNIDKEAFLTEHNVMEARVVEDPLGGFSLSTKFNRKGTWLLEQYSTGNKGKRVAIYCSIQTNAWWIAAPILNKRITNGVFSFTPDASREEADRMVRGLNELGEQVKADDEFLK